MATVTGNYPYQAHDEELAKYMDRLGIKCRYIHSELKRWNGWMILRGLRLGEFDVLIGIKPVAGRIGSAEVSLVAIWMLIRGLFTVGEIIDPNYWPCCTERQGQVIMYADKNYSLDADNDG